MDDENYAVGSQAEPPAMTRPRGAAEALRTLLPPGSLISESGGKGRLLRIQLPPGHARLLRCSPSVARAVRPLLAQTDVGLGGTLLLGSLDVLTVGLPRHGGPAPPRQFRKSDPVHGERPRTPWQELDQEIRRDVPLVVLISLPSDQRTPDILRVWEGWKDWLGREMQVLGFPPNDHLVDLSGLPSQTALRRAEEIISGGAHVAAILHNDSPRGSPEPTRLEVGERGWITVSDLARWMPTGQGQCLFWACDTEATDFLPGLRAVRTSGTMLLDPDASLFALAILLAFARVYGTPTLTCDEAYRWVNAFHQQLSWLESSLDPEASVNPWVRSACMLVQRGDMQTRYSVARPRGSVRGRLRVKQMEEGEASVAQLVDTLGPVPARAAALLCDRAPLPPGSLIVAVDRRDTLLAAVGSTAIEAGRRAWEAVRRGEQWTLVVDCPDGQAAGGLRPRCLIAPGGATEQASELLHVMAAETGSWFAVADQAEAMNTPRPSITQGGVQHDSRDTSHKAD